MSTSGRTRHTLAVTGLVAMMGGVGLVSAPPATAGPRPTVQSSTRCRVVVLHYGMVNHYVGILQRRLHLVRDNSFGPATLRAVRSYQRRHGLTVDGYVGPRTWRSLGGFPGCDRTPARTAWVASTDHRVNVHSDNRIGSRVVGHLGKGRRVRVVPASKNWVRIAGTHRYVAKGVLEYETGNLRGLNGHLGRLNLCGIRHAYNSPDSFAPGYTRHTTRYVSCHLVKYLNRLERHFKRRFGHYAKIDLAARSLKEQWYWYRKLGSPRAAYPGTSNHGFGVAIDFTSRGKAFDWGGDGNDWLRRHADDWGFKNPFRYGTPGEAEHFNFVG